LFFVFLGFNIIDFKFSSLRCEI